MSNYFLIFSHSLLFKQVSLAWKGITLERRYGTVGFTCLLIFFTGSTGLMYVFLARAVSQVMQDQSYFHECAVGFSAVLFALKVIVVCCCTLNNKTIRWWTFIRQVITNTGSYQLPLSQCNTLHWKRFLAPGLVRQVYVTSLAIAHSQHNYWY